MAHAQNCMRYGGRQCKSITGNPAKTTSFRRPAEFIEFVVARIDAGDARSITEYLLGLVRDAASRLGVQL